MSICNDASQSSGQARLLTVTSTFLLTLQLECALTIFFTVARGYIFCPGAILYYGTGSTMLASSERRGSISCRGWIVDIHGFQGCWRLNGQIGRHNLPSRVPPITNHMQ